MHATCMSWGVLDAACSTAHCCVGLVWMTIIRVATKQAPKVYCCLPQTIMFLIHQLCFCNACLHRDGQIAPCRSCTDIVSVQYCLSSTGLRKLDYQFQAIAMSDHDGQTMVGHCAQARLKAEQAFSPS